VIKACASGVKTTWETVPGAAPYNVCRSAAGGAYAGIGTGRTPGCVDRTAGSGVTYRCYVTARFSKYKSSHAPAASAAAK
jgi:hypothetical protein